jgi:hypothetical protein
VELPVNLEVESLADVFSRGNEQVVMRPPVTVELQNEDVIDENRLENVRPERVKALRCLLPGRDVARKGDREKPNVPEPILPDELEDVFSERIDAPALRCGGTISAVLD